MNKQEAQHKAIGMEINKPDKWKSNPFAKKYRAKLEANKKTK